MASFAPTISSDIGFVQPVQQPSALEGVAGLVQGFAASLKANSESTTSVSKQLAADKETFYSSLQKGQALINQGKSAQGNQLIQKAYRSFARRYGREEEDVNKAYQDATGVSFDVEVAGTPVNYDQFTSTPEFNVAAATIQMQNPDASPDEVFAAALQKEVERQSIDVKIAEIEKKEKVNWYEVEETYVSKARGVLSTARDMIATADSDRIITPDEARTLREFYRDKITSLTKPMGVDQTHWDNFKKNYVDSVTAIVGGTIDLSENANVSTDMRRALDQIISKAMSQDKLPASLLIRMQGDSVDTYDSFIELLKTADKDPKYTENYNYLANASFDELVDWVTSFEEKSDVDDLKLDLTEFNSRSDKEKRDSLISGTSLIKQSAGPEQLAISLLETNKKLEGVATKALQPEDFSKVFNPSYFASIEKVYKANPTIGRQIAQDAVRAIGSQQIAITEAINSEAAQLGLKVSPEGLLLPDKELLGASIQREVDLVYGGDWNAAFDDGGEASFRAGYPGIRDVSRRAKSILTPRIMKFKRATEAVDMLKEKYLKAEVTGLPKEGTVMEADSDTTAIGSAGTDTVASGSSLKLLKMMDKKEGGGDYSTLFGHSQKQGGAFAGVDVTKMTIGEVLNFQKQRGEGSYGTWVKSKNPKGALATPVGRYQVVGRTLEQVVKEMGLPTNILFTPKVQDAVFHHLASKALAGKTTAAAKREAMRGTWDGFNYPPGASAETKKRLDAELDAAIAEFEGTPEPSYEELQKEPGAMQTAPSTSLRPEARTEEAEDLARIQAGGTSTEITPVEEEQQGNLMGTVARGSHEGISTASKSEISALSASTRKMLNRLSIDTEDLPSFQSYEDAMEALSSGAIAEDEVVLINGQLEVM